MKSLIVPEHCVPKVRNPELAGEHLQWVLPLQRMTACRPPVNLGGNYEILEQTPVA